MSPHTLPTPARCRSKPLVGGFASVRSSFFCFSINQWDSLAVGGVCGRGGCPLVRLPRTSVPWHWGGGSRQQCLPLSICAAQTSAVAFKQHGNAAYRPGCPFWVLWVDAGKGGVVEGRGLVLGRGLGRDPLHSLPPPSPRRGLPPPWGLPRCHRPVHKSVPCLLHCHPCFSAFFVCCLRFCRDGVEKRTVPPFI